MQGEIAHFFTAVAWTLFHSTWQGVIAAVAYWTCRRCTTSAATRYFIGHTALGVFLLAQVLTFSVAASSLPVLFNWIAGGYQPQPLAPSGQSAFRDLPVIPFAAVVAATEPFLPWLGITWLSFAVARLSWFSALWIALQYELRRCIEVAEPAAAGLRLLADRLRVKAAFWECEAITVPGTVGWFRPVVLVPVGWICSTPAREVEAIILHELAHIARRDFAGNILRLFTRSLFYFHLPLLWMTRQLDEDAEQATDVLAASKHGDLEAYGIALMRLEITRPALAMTLGAGGGTLSSRLRHLVETKGGVRHNSVRLLSFAAASGLSLFSVAYAATAAASNRTELEWLNARDFTTSVLETLASTAPNPAAERLLAAVHADPAPSAQALRDLAAALNAGFDPSLFKREAARVDLTRSLVEADLPTFGTYADRQRLVALMRQQCRASTGVDRGMFARAALILAVLDPMTSSASLGAAMVVEDGFPNELQVEAAAKRRIEHATTLHNKRLAGVLRVTTPLGKAGVLNDRDLATVRELLRYLPGQQRRLMRSPNAALREQLMSSSDPPPSSR